MRKRSRLRRLLLVLGAILGVATAVAVIAAIITDVPTPRRPHVRRSRASAAAQATARAERGDAVSFPPLNHVYGRATHNAYFTGRHPHELPWPLAPTTGTQERALDQLLHEGVASLEIDLHRAAPGRWAIYHTHSRENSRFETLDDALEVLRVFHRALPRHEVVNVIVELKETWPVWPLASARAFDETHTMNELDETFRRALGPALFTPKDLLARAPGASDLLEAAARAGWPTTGELRGRFIVSVLGNWSNASFEWARYATTDVAERVAFPMRSVMQVDGSGDSAWPGGAHEEIPAAMMATARRNSVVWQLEDLDYDPAAVAEFVRANGIMRSCNADGFQPYVIERGVQLIQLDYPWFFDAGVAVPPDGLPCDPRRRLFARKGAGIDDDALLEPGNRIYFSSKGPLFRFARLEAVSRERLETLVAGSTLSDSDAFPEAADVDGAAGALRAESEDGSEWVSIARELDFRARGEIVVVVSGTSARGPIERRVVAGPFEPAATGEMLLLELENRGPSGCEVTVRSAGRLAGPGPLAEPDWTSLGAFSFSKPLRRAGLATTRGDVLFVHPRRGAGGGPLSDLRLDDLPDERSETPEGRVVDLFVPDRR